jgi:hypothetical protein
VTNTSSGSDEDVDPVTRHAERVSGGVWVGAILAGLFFLVCVQMTKVHPASWNESSRLAAIESFVERGTWQIDESPRAAFTMDKAFIRGKFYSDKMPLLNLAGAGVYALLRWVRGATLALDCGRSGRSCAYYGLTLILVGLPVTGLVWLFFDFLRRRVNIIAASAATTALAFGAMVWPYSLVLNHNLLSGVMLFASFYLISTYRNVLGWLAAGFCAALAVSFDLVSIIMCASIVAIAMVRARRGLAYFAAGALVPLLITVILDYQITGTIAPPYLIPGAYAFPGSNFADTPGGVAPPSSVVEYGFGMLVGAHGLFAYSPVLLFALAGLAIAAFTREDPLRLEAACLGIGYVVLTAYLITHTYNFGGMAHGERLYLSAVPLVMVFAAYPLERVRWRRPVAALFAAFLTVSVLSDWRGARQPWKYIPPPGYLTLDPKTGTIGVGWNAR